MILTFEPAVEEPRKVMQVTSPGFEFCQMPYIVWVPILKLDVFEGTDKQLATALSKVKGLEVAIVQPDHLLISVTNQSNQFRRVARRVCLAIEATFGQPIEPDLTRLRRGNPKDRTRMEVWRLFQPAAPKL